MKRISGALLLTCAFLQMATAKPVDVASARLVAINAYYEQAGIHKTLGYHAISAELATTGHEAGETCYYIFNINAGGFVVIAADDAVWPVLGFSFEGSYGSETPPPAFTRWLQDYNTQVRIAREENFSAGHSVTAEWERLSGQEPPALRNIKFTLPLLHTRWDQGKFYNEFCPPDQAGPDGHVWAGCVPTAMAQIMNYWRWPLTGTGSYAYFDSIYGTLSADFGSTEYRWNQMPAILNGYNSAVAELLFHLGVSVDLKYGPNGSGMYNHKAAYSLRTHFGYSPLTEYVFRDTCTLNWKALVLQHLDNRMPLYYAGWADTINQSGHAFVCDGYQDTSYFHMNWGWSGSYNGYFLLDDLTPGSADFTLDHELIVNIFPDGAYPYYCQGIDTIKVLSSAMDDGSGPVHNYPDHADCMWLIAPEDSVVHIRLRFVRFDLHESDTLFVYNGGSLAAPVLAKLTGSSLPPVLTASSDRVLLHFVSDDSLNAGGFLLKDSTTVATFCSGTTTLTAQAGFLEDGSGTFNYHNNSTCRWNIEPPGATAITVQFNRVDLAEGDFINVQDLVTGTLLKHITGDTIPAPIVCPSAKVRIFFRADGKYTDGGWSLNYFVSSGITEHNELAGLRIIPNPAAAHFYITDIPDNLKTIDAEMISSSGLTVLRKKLDSKGSDAGIRIETHGLPSGIYFLKLTTERSFTVKKIIIL